ncbi:MAG: DNA-protecting protein DprA [Acidobacteria bacterium]|nr:DNA-protecting protein DprA [Acidobacteriota bacterium]
MRDLADFIALSLLPLHLGFDVAEALRTGRRPGEIFDRLLADRCGGGPEPRARIAAQTARAIDMASQAGIDVVTWGDPSYPAALEAIADPPPALWIRGSRHALGARPCVAIVGSRAATPYAATVAGRLAHDLAARGIAIVSGLARGADSAAHRGALRAAGTTIGVLGSGADVIYPREHRTLAQEMCARGAVVSELVPGTQPQPMFFPRRNRIISGLSRAVVVVEAGDRSGSLITARCAAEQGRDVLAVPGSVLTGRNRGAHALLRDGAKIVESADDILEELGAGVHARASASTPETDPVLAHLEAGEACDLDAIAARAGLRPAALLPRLLELELQGRVRRAGGGRFVRVDSPW